MANTIQLKRRVAGVAGAPAALKSGELAHNEVDNTLYVGKGDEPHFVKADFKALGGQEAIAAEARGVTQKYRITKQLAKVIQIELTSPEGYQAANLDFLGAINQL